MGQGPPLGLVRRSQTGTRQQHDHSEVIRALRKQFHNFGGLTQQAVTGTSLIALPSVLDPRPKDLGSANGKGAQGAYRQCCIKGRRNRLVSYILTERVGPNWLQHLQSADSFAGGGAKVFASKFFPCQAGWLGAVWDRFPGWSGQHASPLAAVGTALKVKEKLLSNYLCAFIFI